MRFLALGALVLAMMAGTAKAADEKKAESPAAQSINDFSFHLYQQMSKDSGNIFFSPYSVYTALGMTYAGASETTKAEFEKVLSISAPNTFSKDLKGINDSLLRDEKSRKTPEDYVFSTGNALWINPTFPVEKKYVDMVKEQFDATASNELSPSVINKWVSDRTNNKIEELIDPKAKTQDMMMILTNTVYFLGKWNRQFDPARTTDLDFYGFDKPQKTSFMSQNGVFGFAEDDNAQYLQMGYQGGDIAMMMVLPKGIEKKKFEKLEQSFDAKALAEVTEKMKFGDVNVTIPKFEMKLGGSILTKLQGMGLNEATDSKAKFCGIVSACSIYIAEVIHKAFIKVDEEGTEASAATAVEMAAGGPAPKFLGTFKADHPFLYLIRDTKSGAILFMGRYVAP